MTVWKRERPQLDTRVSSPVWGQMTILWETNRKSLKVLSHLDRRELFVCLVVFFPKWGCVSALSRFVRTWLNAAVALWCGANQQSRGPQEEEGLGLIPTEPWSSLFGVRTQPARELHLQPGNWCSKIVCHSGQSHGWCGPRTLACRCHGTVAFPYSVFKRFAVSVAGENVSKCQRGISPLCCSKLSLLCCCCHDTAPQCKVQPGIMRKAQTV